MNVSGYSKLNKLESYPLWLEACELAEYMYAKLAEFPEEEKWVTASKIRGMANDVMYYIAQGLSYGGPNYYEYDWSYGRKTVATLKTMYRFAGRQKFIELEPSIMVRLDKLLVAVDNELKLAFEKSQEQNKQEIADIRRKYELDKKAKA